MGSELSSELAVIKQQQLQLKTIAQTGSHNHRTVGDEFSREDLVSTIVNDALAASPYLFTQADGDKGVQYLPFEHDDLSSTVPRLRSRSTRRLNGVIESSKKSGHKLFNEIKSIRGNLDKSDAYYSSTSALQQKILNRKLPPLDNRSRSTLEPDRPINKLDLSDRYLNKVEQQQKRLMEVSFKHLEDSAKNNSDETLELQHLKNQV